VLPSGLCILNAEQPLELSYQVVAKMPHEYQSSESHDSGTGQLGRSQIKNNSREELFTANQKFLNSSRK
jgi:hypothetical protein